jgi:intein/homing endonuclease
MSSEIYSGNPQLKKAYTNIEFTPEQVDEIIKCRKDPVYFAKKYIKIISVDEGVVPFNMYKFQEKLITRFHKNRFNICKLPRQSGKALALDTPIPTPEGWTTMGEIKVGDIILSPNGRPVSVTMKTETMYNHSCYKLYFDNGEEIIADADHLWEVNSSYWTSGKKILRTQDIANVYEKKTKNKRGLGVQGSYYIELAKHIDNFIDGELPINPYLLGVWLGDGYSADGRVISHKDDFSYYKTKIEVEHFKEQDNCIRFKCINLYQKLKENKLLKNKHIPQKYLRASYSDRLELLRGLMDTDGSVKPNSRSFEFYQKNYELIEQVVELLSTLSIKSKVRVKKINGCLYYTISFTTKEVVFNLPRKINLIDKFKSTRIQDKRHYIQKIEKVDSVPVACIRVDSEDHLFLCGKTFIPTHNSTTAVSYLLHYAIFNSDVNIAILANKAQTAKDLLARLQLAYENLPKWMQHGVKIWNKASLELDNGSKILAASTSASSVRGGTYNIIFLDEFAFIPNQIAEEFFRSTYPTVTSGKDTKVIIVSCVVKNTYVLTPSGYSKIDNFIDHSRNGAYEVDEYSVYGMDKFRSGNIVFNNGKAPTKIIKTRYGDLECSHEHKLWACKNGTYGWVKSKDLNIGDYIPVHYNQQVFGNDDYIGFYTEKGKSKNTFSCEYITPDISYFLGLFIAEGYARDIVSKDTNNITGGQVIITSGDDIREELNKLNLTYTKKDDFHYCINSKDLVSFIKHIGFDIGLKSPKKVIPQRLLSLSKDNILALIQGLFDGDGCSNNNRMRVTYTSTSKELIQQIQLLLANLGVLGNVNFHKTAPTQKVKVESSVYCIEINGNQAIKYLTDIGFRLKRKQITFENVEYKNRIGNNNDIIPFAKKYLKENYNNDIRNLGIFKKYFIQTENISRTELLKLKKELIQLNIDNLNEFLIDNVKENLVWYKIKNIEESENEVYDFSLPEIEEDKWCHSVLYNNFLGHQTPKGMNMYYKLWTEAERGQNEYVPTEVAWNEIPGRDKKFREQTISNIGADAWNQEFECSFLGSAGTLIAPSKLKTLVHDKPISRSDSLDIYKEPQKNRIYLIVVDCSEGVGKDYHAFIVFDITSIPYTIAAKYKNNELKPMLLADIIKRVAVAYNNAYIIVEIASVGEQVAKTIHYDLEYGNLLMSMVNGRAGQVIGQNFYGKNSQYGLKISKQVKRVGCSNLKTIVEDDKLLIRDIEIISELTTYISKNNSYEAEIGANDDLVSCLVIFAWFIVQDYFKDLTNNDIRKKLSEEQKEQLDSELIPLGFFNDGIDSDEERIIDKSTGDLWIAANKSPAYESLEFDINMGSYNYMY